MQVDSSKVKVRTSYNVAALAFAVKDLAQAINKKSPLKVTYKPDERQKIANSWPDSMDDS